MYDNSDKYVRDNVRLFLVDGSQVEGAIEFFSGSRLTDMLNAKYDRDQFIKIYSAKVVFADKKELIAPWVIINRHCVNGYIEMSKPEQTGE